MVTSVSFLIFAGLALVTHKVCCGQKLPYIHAWHEARHIALAASDEILATAKMVQNIATDITLIRQQYPVVENVKNNGRWFLGKIRIYYYDTKIMFKLQTSGYGPVESVSDGEGNTTLVKFMKPYNPLLLADRITTELGILSQAIWLEGPDYGEIIYQPHRTYTFRQGLENCGLDCNMNLFWVFKFHNMFNSTLLYEYATDIPIQSELPADWEDTYDFS